MLSRDIQDDIQGTFSFSKKGFQLLSTLKLGNKQKQNTVQLRQLKYVFKQNTIGY